MWRKQTAFFFILPLTSISIWCRHYVKLPSSWKERLIDWESSPQSTQCGLRHGLTGRPWRRILSPLGGRITASRTSTSGGTQSSLKAQLGGLRKVRGAEKNQVSELFFYLPTWIQTTAPNVGKYSMYGADGNGWRLGHGFQPSKNRDCRKGVPEML